MTLDPGAERAAQGRVVVVDAGVDDGDGHAGPVHIVIGSDLGGADDRVISRGRTRDEGAGRPLALLRAGGMMPDQEMVSLFRRRSFVSRPGQTGMLMADFRDDACRVGSQSRREETPVVQSFEMRPMTKTATSAALVNGPSHESCLPGRPPDHWLRPPRESVVNALLPWRARVAADSVRPRIRTRRLATIGDRREPFRAQAKVGRDGPPDGLRSHPKIDHIQA